MGSQRFTGAEFRFVRCKSPGDLLHNNFNVLKITALDT